MPLISYVKTATNKRYSYPRVAAIQIDVHSAGKNPIHMTCMLPPLIHVYPAYTSYEQSTYVTIFHESSTKLSRVTAPEKKGSRHNPQYIGWPIHGSVPSFLLKPTLKQWGQSQASIDGRLLGLLSPYHQHVIGTFNTYLRGGGNPLVLNRHRWRLQPWRCRLSIYHSPTFPTSCLSFPPKGVVRSHVIHLYNYQLNLKREQTLNLMSGSLHSTSTITWHLSLAGANDIPPR
jgi:hypothetical protein